MALSDEAASWAPAWWPPKAGDKLRHFTLHRNNDGRLTQIHALAHVVAVFQHAGETIATVAEWPQDRHRWVYTTIHGWLEARQSYWPDGQDPPEKHESSPGNPCECCK
jgi:hypothetical protein